MDKYIQKRIKTIFQFNAIDMFSSVFSSVEKGEEG